MIIILLYCDIKDLPGKAFFCESREDSNLTSRPCYHTYYTGTVYGRVSPVWISALPTAGVSPGEAAPGLP